MGSGLAKMAETTATPEAPALEHNRQEEEEQERTSLMASPHLFASSPPMATHGISQPLHTYRSLVSQSSAYKGKLGTLLRPSKPIAELSLVLVG